MKKKYSILLEDIRQKNDLRIYYLENKLHHTSVDIIMPVFNRQNTIKKSIESVLIQSHPNWNLYIWDDGSTDNTRAYCNEYESNLRIHYYYSPKIMAFLIPKPMLKAEPNLQLWHILIATMNRT